MTKKKKKVTNKSLKQIYLGLMENIFLEISDFSIYLTICPEKKKKDGKWPFQWPCFPLLEEDSWQVDIWTVCYYRFQILWLSLTQLLGFYLEFLWKVKQHTYSLFLPQRPQLKNTPYKSTQLFPKLLLERYKRWQTQELVCTKIRFTSLLV